LPGFSVSAQDLPPTFEWEYNELYSFEAYSNNLGNFTTFDGWTKIPNSGNYWGSLLDSGINEYVFMYDIGFRSSTDIKRDVLIEGDPRAFKIIFEIEIARNSYNSSEEYLTIYMGNTKVGVQKLTENISVYQFFTMETPYIITDNDGNVEIKITVEANNTAHSVFYKRLKIIQALGPNRDQIFQEEQRGFWAKLFDFLLNLPTRISDLLIDGLKTLFQLLFIPEEGFFEGIIANFEYQFNEHFGLLIYPFTAFANIINRFINLKDGPYIITIPELKYDNTVIFSSMQYNFSDILNGNQIFTTIRNIYLLVVDGIIAFGFINVVVKKWEEVTK